jgi:hypothetical protein
MAAARTTAPLDAPTGLPLSEVVELLGARAVTHGERLGGVRVVRVAASNLVSDLLAQAGGASLLLSELRGPELVRIAGLFDVPAICLAGTEAVRDDLVRAASAAGTVMIATPRDLAASCRRLVVRGLLPGDQP